VKNCGGYLGIAYPGGGRFSLQFDELERLGSGSHCVQVDEHEHAVKGVRPNLSTDEQLVENVRFDLFAERTGTLTVRWMLCTILLSFNTQTAKQIAALLNTSQLEELMQYAYKISSSKEERDRLEFKILSSNGSEKIPDENLVALRNYFVKEG
jgi:hypothetical protein